MATIEKRIYDGDQARLVLENEAFAQAFDDIEKEYTKAWMESPARDEEGREKLYLTLKMLHKLRTTLEATMNDGKLAHATMVHNQSKSDRLREWIGLS